jgi:YVTN family beta-propeller protein
VRPNSVAVVDPHTGRLVADVQVGSRPVAVAAGAGGVWVANADDGTVSRIDPKTHRVTATIGIGTDVSDIAVGFGSVWVAGGNDSTLTQIDPTLNPPGIEATRHFGSKTLAPQPIFSVTSGSSGVWLTRGSSLVLVDPRSGRAVHSYPIPSPVGLAAGGGSIWVTTQDERLMRYSPTGVRTGSLSLPSTAVPAFGEGALWLVVFLGTGAVWQVDPSSMTPSATLTLRTVPNELAVGEGGVWAAGSGLLTQIDPLTAGPVRAVKLGLEPVAVAVGEGGVWVTVQRPG